MRRTKERKAGKDTLGGRGWMNRVLRQKTAGVGRWEMVIQGGTRDVTRGGASGPPPAAARAQLGPCILSLRGDGAADGDLGIH